MRDPVLADCGDENEVEPMPESPKITEIAGVSGVPRSKHAQFLTPHERLAVTRLGILDVCNDFVSACGVSQKSALSNPLDLLKATAGGMALLAAIGGIPVGAAAHYIGRGSKVRDAKEKELIQRIKDYREIATRLEGGIQEGV